MLKPQTVSFLWLAYYDIKCGFKEYVMSSLLFKPCDGQNNWKAFGWETNRTIGSGLPPFTIKCDINFHKICNIKSFKLFNTFILVIFVRKRQRALGTWQFYGKDNFFSFYHCCNIKQGVQYFLRLWLKRGVFGKFHPSEFYMFTVPYHAAKLEKIFRGDPEI